jgi:hypothetical protein
MPAPRRAKNGPTDDWEQLRFRFTWPEQASYELIRPVVLFGRAAGLRTSQSALFHACSDNYAIFSTGHGQGQ